MRAAPMTLMLITNDTRLAAIAEQNTVRRIWIDLERMGKRERQGDHGSVISDHTMEDITRMRQALTSAEIVVRINPLHPGSAAEVDEVIRRGADWIMLPMVTTAFDVQRFIELVGGRAKTMPLFETRQAHACLKEIVALEGIDACYIGLNDLQLSYGHRFMFEPLACGIVEDMCRTIAAKGIPFGFGGIARLMDGTLPAWRVVAEHYRLGSGMTVLSRSFQAGWKDLPEDALRAAFSCAVEDIRAYEAQLQTEDARYFLDNQAQTKRIVEHIAGMCYA